MQGVCIARYIRYSPRKIAQVLKIIRGKNVAEVFKILDNVNKSCSLDIKKAVKSALANAGGLKEPHKFYLSTCYVTKGPYMKRIMPRAFGRAALYTRKTAHLTVVVSDRLEKSKSS
ncbi:MAG: 50S ribosomal protein L22 [Endomicrobia bacterium]|nr:50S ribosomal protein L22 [Endomicrobiia bacterium]MCX7941395.1 50S ribosomal protein L22 [Endomicrobiia bacterium]